MQPGSTRGIDWLDWTSTHTAQNRTAEEKEENPGGKKRGEDWSFSSGLDGSVETLLSFDTR